MKSNLSPLIILGICAFVMILIEFIPISLLTNIADSFVVDATIIGLSVSVYAVIGASFGIIFALFLDNGYRKNLLISIF